MRRCRDAQRVGGVWEVGVQGVWGWMGGGVRRAADGLVEVRGWG